MPSVSLLIGWGHISCCARFGRMVGSISLSVVALHQQTAGLECPATLQTSLHSLALVCHVHCHAGMRVSPCRGGGLVLSAYCQCAMNRCLHVRKCRARQQDFPSCRAVAEALQVSHPSASYAEHLLPGSEQDVGCGHDFMSTIMSWFPIQNIDQIWTRFSPVRDKVKPHQR